MSANPVLCVCVFICIVTMLSFGVVLCLYCSIVSCCRVSTRSGDCVRNDDAQKRNNRSRKPHYITRVILKKT